jgi:hypothetical protein
MKLEHALADGRRLVTEVDDDLEPAGRDVLAELAECDQRGPRLATGSKVSFGWTMLILEETEPGVLAVREPRYAADDPRETQYGVSETVRVLVGQLAVCKLAEVAPRAAWFGSAVAMDPAALTASKVYLQRHEPTSEIDSGWYLGCVDGDGPAIDELRRIGVWQIIAQRRALSSALALPPGYLAVFVDDQIDAIVDADNRERFKRR